MISELRAIDSRLDEAIGRGNVLGYLEQNYRFHFRLYEQAGAEVLLAMAKGLWMRVGPSLRVVCGRYGTANLPDQHGAAMAALATGQPHKVCAAIERDIVQGLDQIRQSMRESHRAG